MRPYRFFYRVVGDTVWIVAVWHGAVRRKARARGKQVEKDKEVADFRTTYSIFVGLLRGSFRLAGQSELANRLTLNQIGNATSPSRQPAPAPVDVPPVPDPPPDVPEPPPSPDEPSDDDEPPPDPSSADPVRESAEPDQHG